MADSAVQLFDPSNNRPLGESPRMNLQQASEHAEAVARAARGWRDSAWSERQRCLNACAALLRQRAGTLALLMASEMGKPVRQGRAECDKCAWVCEYYAQHAQAFLRSKPIETDAQHSFVAFEPLGVVFAVMPWNFPLWQVFRCAAPALAAGNGVLLKHASNVPGCAEAIAELCRDAGFPAQLFGVVHCDGHTASQLIAHRAIAAVSLTGSVAAGRKVAAAAGQALKKCVLELGGADPYVVLSDADLELAAKVCVDSRLQNAGQSCIAAKRFIVVRQLCRQFSERVVQAMAQRKLGDPTDEQTEIGPMARVDLRDELHQQVQASIASGATLLLGGRLPDRPGAWYPATVLGNVTPGMPAYDEELFGPVAAIIEAAGDEDALRIANDTSFGLGAAVFTRDLARGEQLARTQLAAGCCFVNSLVRSDPRLPFGGIKDSGFGRELGTFGIREFVNVKTVYVAG